MTFRAPLGQADFAQIRRQGLVYVDKSQLIVDLLEDSALVVLLPRPRRFGKTTNLSMLRAWFERVSDGADRADLFQDLEVWRSAQARAHFQRYPVIALTLKELKPTSWEACLADLRLLLADCYQQHEWLLSWPGLRAGDRRRYEAVLSGEAPPELLRRALLDLSALLHEATGEQVVLLIDEYDTPIHAGWLHGYYDEVIGFFRVFLGAALKDSPHLARGVLTGILRVSKESIFSDLNNLRVYTLLREEYSAAFGFTEEEVQVLAEQADAGALLPEIRRWYNGYRFGNATIYNPWSILSFLSSRDRELRPYWVNTSGNELIGQLITQGQAQASQALEILLRGGRVRQPIEDGLVLPDLRRDANAVWTLLLYSGYLRPAAIYEAGREVDLEIPNQEVMLAFDLLLQRWMRGQVGGSGEVDALLRAMLRGDVESFEDGLSTLVIHAMSSLDGGRTPEQVYHAFTLGLLVQLRATHRVESNPESGFGRADVLVIPRTPGQAGVVLEFKRVREQDTPEGALQAALQQIADRRYAAKLEDAGAAPVWVYGVVFDGKRVRVGMG